MANSKENKQIKVGFSALNPFLEDNIVKPTEKSVRAQNFIEWGDRNQYPTYLFGLYTSVPSLHSIINAVVDYVKGNEVISKIPTLSDDDALQLVEDIAFQYCVYGNVAVNVLRNRVGNVAKLEVLDFKNVRSDKKNENFYYSEDFAKKSYGRGNYIELPRFDANDKTIPSSIFSFKTNKYSTYGQPLYAASTLACEMEKDINQFQFNEIQNGFASNVIIAMNNGQPTDEVKEEIEELIYEKFEGYQNAGRPLIVYNQDKEHSVEVLKVDTDSFIDKYNAASQRAREEIFASWRINKNLVGISTDNIGFSAEEFEQSFALVNKTLILPIQKKIIKALNTIYGVDESIEIKPFTLDIENKEEKTVE